MLGEMLELGDAAHAEHAEVGRLAAALGIARVVAVGEGTRALAAGAGAAGVWVPDVAAALALLREEIRSGDVVLVKASRSIGLERLAAQLLVDALPAAVGTLPPPVPSPVLHREVTP